MPKCQCEQNTTFCNHPTGCTKEATKIVATIHGPFSMCTPCANEMYLYQRRSIVDNLLAKDASFILGTGAGITAHNTIRGLLETALLDEQVFNYQWKVFLKENR